MALRIGDCIENRFDIISHLGQGGMATVFKAWDRQLERFVAAKALLPELMDHPRALSEMKEETKLGQRLSHPHVVCVFDFRLWSGQPVILMEFVAGVPLDHFLHRLPGGRATTAQFDGWARQILDAVAFAHECGVVHRDLKPGNIMVETSGRLKVMDFGLAVVMRSMAGASYSSSGYTLQYSSPEQLRGGVPAPSMDIYSLGCVFYHVLAGRPPFVDGDIRLQHLQAQAPQIPFVSPSTRSVVERCLRKRPEDRFKSVAEIGLALWGGLPNSHPPIVSPPLESPKSAGWEIVLLDGAKAGKAIRLSAESARDGLLIGRMSAEVRGGIQIPDPSCTMSRRHAMLSWSTAKGSFELEVLSAASPTLVNGRPCANGSLHPLREGDVIQMGGMKLMLRARTGRCAS